MNVSLKGANSQFVYMKRFLYLSYLFDLGFLLEFSFVIWHISIAQRNMQHFVQAKFVLNLIL